MVDFDYTDDVMVDFGKLILIVDNSLKFETKCLLFIPIIYYKLSGVKLACSTFKIFLL